MLITHLYVEGLNNTELNVYYILESDILISTPLTDIYEWK